MEKFKLGKKWFWIGMVCGFHIGFGLIYGIALFLEKKFRKEALIIILWTIIWFILCSTLIVPFLKARGLLPTLVVEPRTIQFKGGFKPGDILPK